MHRFIRPSFLLAAITLGLSGFAAATPITMNNTATFTGGLDLAINSPDNDTTPR